MEKAHSRIKWENYPSIATPLNETNLNKMDIALDEVDNRVLGLDTAKLDKAVANTMVKDVSFVEATGIFTVTLLDGTTKTFDTKLEKIATNFRYDNQSQKLLIELADGSEQEVDLSSLITNYEFVDGDIIAFSIGDDGKVTANIKDGTVTENKLQPNFLADVKTEVAKAKGYSDSSYENATTSRNAVNEAKKYRDEALQFRNEAEEFAPEGYEELKQQVNENTFKVDTIIEHTDLGIKETASGEEIHLTDSADGKAVEYALFGKARQNTTSGKNKFELRKNNIESNGIKVTINNDGTFNASGTATDSTYISLEQNTNELAEIISKGGNFTMSLKNATYNVYSCNINLGYKNASGANTNIVANGTAKYVDVGSSYRNFVLYVGSGVTIDLKNVGIQLESGTVATEWEEYSGGMASPNPQFPQPIEVSGESYNLLESTATSQTINGVEFVVNEDKSITINGTATEGIGNCYLSQKNMILDDMLATCEGISNLSGIYFAVNNGSTTFNVYGTKTEVSLNGTMNYARIYIDKGATFNNATIYPMIRKASVKNDRYMPYGKGSVEVTSSNEDNTKTKKATIPTENGLAGIKVSENGNYTDQNGQQWICDEVVKNADGSGAYVQRIIKLKANSVLGGYNGVQNVFVGMISTDCKKTDNATIGNVLCNICLAETANRQYYNNNTCVAMSIDGNVLLTIKDITTLEEMNTFLSENDVYVVYELATPIHTPLTAEELAEISTFYPVTNISNDFDCGMRVKYNCDSKNYIDNKLAEITKAMINNI